MSGALRLLRIITLIVFSSVSIALWAFSKASGSELELFEAANRERHRHGLSTLKWDESLATAARKHAAEMLKHNSVSHQFPEEPSLPSRANQAGVRFTWISENVDQGRGAEIIHDRLMKSALHRSNILDRDMDTVGIGVAQRNGQLFVVEDFSKAK
jgi:uncharacterized protein YkwD